MDILWIVLVGLVAGWLAGQFIRGGGFGLGGNIAVGIVGAFLGSWLFGQLGFAAGGGFFSAVFRATIGAALLLLLIRVAKRV